MTSPFDHVPLAPRDPIIGVTEAFQADGRPDKVNPGVGVYYDNDGRVPLLDCVAEVERRLAEAAGPRGYLPIDGIPDFQRSVQELVFGGNAEPVDAGVDDRPREAERRRHVARPPRELRARQARGGRSGGRGRASGGRRRSLPA